jgi:hypothetical protein
LSDKGKTVITQAINAGPWSASQVKDLASILLHGKNASAKSSKAANRRNNQKCVHFENFIPMSVIIKLRDSVKYSQLSRASILAATARSIGIELPDLPTLFRMVAIIAYLEGNCDYKQDEVFKLMNSVQRFIKSVPRDNSLPFIEHYPVEVSGLPEPLRKHAYTPDDLPVVVDWPELSTVLGSNKMKGGKDDQNKGSKLPAWLEHVPKEHKDAVLNAVKSPSKACSSNEAQPRREPQGHQSLPPPPSPRTPAPQQWHASNHHADVFRFQAPPPATSHTAGSDAARTVNGDKIWNGDEEEDEDEDEKQADGDTCGIEQMEADMVAALQTRKRPSGSSMALNKKPAGKQTSMKKPAAAKCSPWRLLHSKVYAQTRKREHDKHGDDERAKEKASAACKKAKVAFEAGKLTLDNWRL